MKRSVQTPAGEFLEELRAATEDYLHAVDAWESEHRKYYRLASPARVSPDLEPEHRAYLQAREHLQELLPEARRLCRKHGLRDPWPGLLHLNLGARQPQAGAASAIGHGERALLDRTLTELEDAAQSLPEPPPAAAGHPGATLLQRILGYLRAALRTRGGTDDPWP